jgi:hypothetical protein
MMLLYAVVPADAKVPAVSGIGGRGVEVVRASAAALVVEECTQAPDLSAETALSFAKVLGRIAATTSLLPVRFPTSMPSREVVGDELERRGSAWSRRLTELEGLAEVSIHVESDETPSGDDGGTPESGAEYLRQRAAAAGQVDAQLAELEAVVAPWSRDTRRLAAGGQTRMAVLANPADYSRLRGALDDWQRANPTCRVRVGGPWPPFTFVDSETGR